MCANSRFVSSRGRISERGFTLIETIIFIVIVGIAIVGIISLINLTTIGGADPVRTKQALAIAESLLEEVQLQAFTYCDPDDANATTATSTAACASTPQGLGPTGGETRYAEPRFDNVGDYHGFSMTGIRDIQNNLISGLGSYSATISEIQSGDEIRIDVTVTNGGTSITLTGYRYRYAPRVVP